MFHLSPDSPADCAHLSFGVLVNLAEEINIKNLPSDVGHPCTAAPVFGKDGDDDLRIAGRCKAGKPPVGLSAGLGRSRLPRRIVLGADEGRPGGSPLPLHDRSKTVVQRLPRRPIRLYASRLA